MGLGDHIITNGLVRTIAKKYDDVFLFCKPKNIKNVKYMYRDLKNLKLIALVDWQVRQFMTISPNLEYKIIGHHEFFERLASPDNKLAIDEIFYEMAGVPFENKWNEFFIQRDLEREKQVFKELGLKEGDKYAFVHEDRRKISKNRPHIKIIKPDNPDYSIFDFLYTIENAEEVHCINSSFSCLIECIQIETPKMFLHQYARDEGESSGDLELGILKMPWEIIK